MIQNSASLLAATVMSKVPYAQRKGIREAIKHPETGKRVSKPNSPENLLTFDIPDSRIIEQPLWDAVKDRQTAQQRLRTKKTATDTNGLSLSQGMRRRKYLLSGLLQCAKCGGNLTVAGSGKARRYYCANAKEKGSSVCDGMPGLKEDLAAETILSGLRKHFMQDVAYQEFKLRFLQRRQRQEEDDGEALRQHDQITKRLERERQNLMRAVKNGIHSDSVISELNTLDAQLAVRPSEREALVRTPVDLPEDLPALYRGHIDNLVATLTDEGVAGRASDELHELLDRVVVSYDIKTKDHFLDMQGNLIAMLRNTKPAEEAGIEANESSLKLVAGAHNQRCRTQLRCHV
ncbi:zinc ribbon domain-containing protein [Phaeobacter sp. CECT 5382]|uniref:zinc ribbon domain-containing protein n=1 Tax=Phaeobacter sp. CECT 5382 TaxID=1712645 RepID=UPI001E505A1C|nr:zinc ribbon domain-containing protein [Phaeobacter sp. CECT 5382]